MTTRATLTSAALTIITALTLGCGGLQPDEGLPPAGDGPGGDIEQLSLPQIGEPGISNSPVQEAVGPANPSVNLLPEVEWQRFQSLQVCNHGKLRVVARDAAQILGQGDFTIDFWVRVDQPQNRPLLKAGNLYIELAGQAIQARVQDQHLISFPIWDQEWYHVALERSGQMLTLYVSGIAVQGMAWGTGWENPTEDFILGGAPEPMHGGCALLDNVRVVPSALYKQRSFVPTQQFKSTEDMVFGFSFDHVQPTEGAFVDESKNSVKAVLGTEARLVESSI